MPTVTERNLGDVVRRAARPLTGAAEDYDPLLERIGDARFILLGEASHGNVGRASAAAGIARIDATAKTTVAGRRSAINTLRIPSLHRATVTRSHRENHNTLCLCDSVACWNDLRLLIHLPV